MDEKTDTVTIPDAHTLYIGADLAAAEWKLAAFSGTSRRPVERSLVAFELSALQTWIEDVRRRLGLDAGPTVFCYEAGRDGFSVYRALTAVGIECLVVDPASIERNARGRKVKTDRVDARQLAMKLRSYRRGDSGVFAVVRVPSVSVEDERRPVREYERLKKERGQHRVRISSLLATVGVVLPLGQHFVAQLREARTAWGDALPERLRSEIIRELERLELTEHHLAELSDSLEPVPGEPVPKVVEQGQLLAELAGVGRITAMTLPREFLWRDFNNRKEVGAAAGLTGTPRATGTSMDIEQGISKTGNSRIRRLMTEIAWSWVRYQPDSPITKWYQERQDGTKRAKRKAITAVARRLLIAFWRYTTQGVVPAGARFSTPAS